MRYWVVLSLLASVFTVGCSDGDSEKFVVDLGLDYFPLEIGKYREYQVDSVIYNPGTFNTVVDSSTSYLREVIADTITDLTGQVTYRVERYERQFLDQEWQIAKVFLLTQDDNRAIWQEDNLRFIKMVFPPKTGQNWDGHAFFNSDLDVPVGGETIEMFKGWSYQTIDTGSPSVISGIPFDDVVIVEHANSENLIEYRYAEEQYARGVGLIYRALNIQDTQCRNCCDTDFAACEVLPWSEKTEIGFTIIQQIIDYN